MNGRRTDIGFDITPEYLSVVYGANNEQRLQIVDYLTKMHPGRITANNYISFGVEALKNTIPNANVGSIGSGNNDVNMINKARIGFSTNKVCQDEARAAADMVLMGDSMGDAVNAIAVGRAYKDHLLKLMLLQIPCSITAIAMVLGQVFYYETIFITGMYVFLINLCYFPMAIACLCRESTIDRKDDMIQRWAADTFPGTKSMTEYMQGERIRFSILVNIAY